MSSPAERYAAARARAAAERSELARFARTLPFELDAFQTDACRALEAGRGVLVAAPTGAGKTVVGEFAVHLALRQGSKAFYTTPIKALSNQKYHDLVAAHGAEAVGLLTGDTTVNGEAPVVVMTTEVLRNMLYAGSRTLDDLGFVVMDEVHYLADRFRGPVWEEVILHLPDRVQLVSLSATVSNAEELGDWLTEVRGDTAVVVSEVRPVPLWQHVLGADGLLDLYAGDVDPTAPGTDPPINPDLVVALRRSARTGPPPWREHRSRSARGGRARPRAVAHGASGRGPRRGVPRVGGGRRAGPRRRCCPRSSSSSPGPAATRRSRSACGPGLRLTTAGRAGGDPRPGHRTLRGDPVRRPGRARVLGVEPGPGAGHRRAPRGPAAGVQGDRRGAVLARAGQGGLRHRDARARDQHARAQRGAGHPDQVGRLGPQRPHAGGVHPAHRAGRAAGDRRRGPRGRRRARPARPRRRSRVSRRAGRTRCGRASGRRTTWRSTSSPRWDGSGPGRSSSRASRSSRPTGRWWAWPGRRGPTRRRWRATPRR